MSEADDHLLARVYDASLDHNQWQNILAPLSGLLGGSSAWLSKQNLSTGGSAGFVWGMDPAVQDSYFKYYKSFDLLSLKPDEMAIEGPVLTDEHRVPKDALLKSTFYNEFMKPAEAHSILMIDLGISADTRSVIHINRPASHQVFANIERRRAARLVPHLRRAMQLSNQFGQTLQRHADLAAAFDAMADAVLLLDLDGRLVHANKTGEAALHAGADLTVAGGKVRATNPDLAGSLHLAITRAASSDPAIRRGDRLVMAGRALSIVPMGQTLPNPGRAAVMLSFPSVHHPAVSTIRLQQIFNLTATEARVALLLLEELSPRGVATRLGTKLQTVRNHMRRIFEKTGVARQSELIRLLMSI